MNRAINNIPQYGSISPNVVENKPIEVIHNNPLLNFKHKSLIDYYKHQYNKPNNPGVSISKNNWNKKLTSYERMWISANHNMSICRDYYVFIPINKQQ